MTVTVVSGTGTFSYSVTLVDGEVVAATFNSEPEPAPPTYADLEDLTYGELETFL